MTAAVSLYDDFLESADIAATLLADPAVAESWNEPSALAEFSVRGLAGHLARQVLHTRDLLAAEPPEGECVTVMEHFTRARWVGASPDHEISVAVRRGGEDVAAGGPEELARRTTAAVVELSGSLPKQPADRLVQATGAPWLLTLPDFLLTRLVEIAVHDDDLSVSVGIDCPPLPTRAADTVLGLLTRLAERRHGTTAVLRALSRAERAPATIAAF
ncbi:MAG: maleylpyruvate isomerase N-terminal domain-containing protein [Nocardiopsaceae bacterium]|nr:maleylpyruvate isomerase N-terminal domain-containing protein [Nocardiopsaceae bacterium]